MDLNADIELVLAIPSSIHQGSAWQFYLTLSVTLVSLQLKCKFSEYYYIMPKNMQVPEEKNSSEHKMTPWISNHIFSKLSVTSFYYRSFNLTF